jgi:hypothetical protein
MGLIGPWVISMGPQIQGPIARSTSPPPAPQVQASNLALDSQADIAKTCMCNPLPEYRHTTPFRGSKICNQQANTCSTP